MGFYEVSQHNRGKCVALGAVFSAGLVFVFAVLAVLIFGLHKLDWGGLFQQTWFTAIITIVLLAMAAGTFGLFDLALPSGVYNLSPRHDTYTGNFLFGMLTAVLSTPCTFGVFAGLLTWALTQPAWIGSVVLVTVGVGMASPYFVLSLFPEAARRFPRTGPWAALVKQEMGFVLLAMAVYFGQPLLGYAMPITATWWLIFAVVVAGAVYLWCRTMLLAKQLWVNIAVGAVVCCVVATALVATERFTSHPYQWKPYTPAALAAATAAGHPVVIDFTATWCGNCHWLEGTVLHDSKVVSAVNRHDVVMLQADVTHDDAVGQPLLNELNPTHAIPLTAVYPPHAAADGRPVTLDGIYSADDLVRSIQHVTGG
jgi:thiol:disulfide interchange protein DsbD